MAVNMNAPIKYFGGKGQMFNKIIEHFPDSSTYDTYIEPFGGSFSIGLKKPNETPIEIYNDLEKNVYSLYKVLSDKELFEQFKIKCDLSYYIADLRNEYRDKLKSDDLSLLDRAFYFFYVNRTSHNGIGGLSVNTVVRRNMCKSVSDMLSCIDRLPELHQRLSKCIFLNQDGINLIEKYNKENVFIYCFSDDTEVLTNNGWKLFKDCDIDNDLFLSREPNTNILEWVKANHFISYHYKGKMYHYSGKEVDLMVTPDHKLFVESVRVKDKGIQYFSTAERLYNKPFKFISSGGIWYGHNEKFININKKIYNLKKFAYLFGIWCTDGSCNKQNNVTIHQTKKSIFNKIKTCLNDLNIAYTIYNDETFYLHKPLSSYFIEFGNKDKRYIPRIIKDASTDIIMSCLEGIIDGDGDNSNDKNGLFGSRRISICHNMKLLSDIQEMLYKIGMSSSYILRKSKKSFLKKENRVINGKEKYIVISIKKKRNFYHINKKHYANEKWVDYDNSVYCVTLDKWHTVLVRRNGKNIWCGQCDPPYEWSTRTSTRYLVDMDREGHLKFIDACLNSKAKILISGYDCEIYDALTDANFTKIKFEVNTIGGNMKPKTKVETLWKNY